MARHPWLACVAGDAVVGYAYASAHRARAAYQWAADVSAYVHPDWRGRRIGQALYTALLSILRLQGHYIAYAGIALPNPASVRLHESCGFVPLGIYRQVGFKLGAWHDVGWWQCELLPRAADPAPPTPLPALAGSAELAAIFAAAIAQT
jgi:L-amino acid N-acyltransferase YncA